MPKPIDEAIKAQALELLEREISAARIAALLGISSTTVVMWRIEAGLPSPANSSTQKASAGLRATFARAAEIGAALIARAPGPDPVYYATLPKPLPDGRQVIGGWIARETAIRVVESLGYRAYLEA